VIARVTRFRGLHPKRDARLTVIPVSQAIPLRSSSPLSKIGSLIFLFVTGGSRAFLGIRLGLLLQRGRGSPAPDLNKVLRMSGEPPRTRTWNPLIKSSVPTNNQQVTPTTMNCCDLRHVAVLRALKSGSIALGRSTSGLVVVKEMVKVETDSSNRSKQPKTTRPSLKCEMCAQKIFDFWPSPE